MLKNDKKIINAWCMYDWANSVYSLVITTAVFPAFYQQFAVGPDGSNQVEFFGLTITNSVLYSYALSASFLMVVCIVPVLSGIADYLGNKKLFMKIFVYIGSLSCISLYFFEGNNVELGILASMMASIGFSSSLVFYDAFLPEIATNDQADRISARGYSLGYIGSVILLVVILLGIQFYDVLGFSSAKSAIQVSFILVGLWWIGFSQIPFYMLPEKRKEGKLTQSVLFSGYRELKKTAQRIAKMGDIKHYLGAYFFYNTGVQTIILLASTFAAEVLNMEQSLLILTILIIQLVAIGGAYLFSWVSGRSGNRKSLIIMVSIWLVICFAAYAVQNTTQFFVLAFFVGLVLGGIQSLSRSSFSKMIPQDTSDHAAFFSFYDITYYISIIMGTFSFGLVQQMTDNMRNNALMLAVYFLIGLVLLLTLKYRWTDHHDGGEPGIR